jgi:NAD+--asparagine ADP-ribosyltransferase
LERHIVEFPEVDLLTSIFSINGIVSPRVVFSRSEKTPKSAIVDEVRLLPFTSAEKSARLNSIGTVESSISSAAKPLFSQLEKRATKRV